MLRPKRALVTLVLFALSFTEASAQLRNHSRSENFRPQERARPAQFRANDPMDGDLSLEEYHRRRLIHEGLRDKQGQPTVRALDVELERTFRSMTNPASLLGFGAAQEERQETGSGRIEREASYLAEMDRQIQRAREERERWEEERLLQEESANSHPEALIADSGQQDSIERSLQEYQEALTPFKERLQEASTMSLSEIQEMARSLPGNENTEVPPKYQDTLAEPLYMALGAFRSQSKDEVKEKLLEAMEGKPVLDQLDEDSRALDAFVDLLQDEEALPDIALILNDRGRLLWFIVVNIILFVLARFWRSSHRKQELSFARSLKLFFLRSFVLGLARLVVLFGFFGPELKRAFTILFQSFN